MKRSNTLLVIASSITVLAACADHPVGTVPETPTIGTEQAIVTGRVVDATGAPVAGAVVELRMIGTHTTTDGTGAFSLDVPANTTLTLAVTGPSMATTLLQQFLLSPAAHAAFDIPLLTSDHVKGLNAMGANVSGGAVAIAIKSLSSASNVAAGTTVELTPSNLGKVLYAPQRGSMPDPDPTMTSLLPGSAFAWALGVQPHVSIMKLALHGVTQAEPPYAIDDVIWPGSFTVDPGALTLVTLFIP
jgi:hypothetical protein